MLPARIAVDKSSSQHLSQTEIAGDNPCSQQFFRNAPVSDYRVNQDFGCNFWIADKPLGTRLASLIIPIFASCPQDPLQPQPTRNYHSGTPHRAICLSGLDGASCHGREQLRPRCRSESFAYWKCLRLGRQPESTSLPVFPLPPNRVHAIRNVRSSCS